MKNKCLIFLLFILAVLAIAGCNSSSDTDGTTDTPKQPTYKPLCVEHIWSEKYTEIPATCTSKGELIYTCTVCSEKKHEYTPKTDHTFSEEWESDGKYHFRRATCGCAFETTDKAEHIWSEGIETTPPTCANYSVISYTCTVCSYVTSDYGTILDHTYSDEWTIDGSWHYHAATCGCINEKSDYELHDWDEGQITTPATCAQTGIRTRTCTVCSATKTETVSKTDNHDWNKSGILTEPTCTKRGYTTYSCTLCSATLKDDYTNTVDHSYEDTVTAPTCQAKGYTTHTCSMCGKYYKDTYKEIIDHSYSSYVYKPTCQSGGYTFHGCTMCDDYYKDNYTAKLPHSYKSVVTTPTCTTKGYTTYTCSSCKESYKGDYTEPTDHDYTVSITPATCAEYAKLLYTCVDCGHSYSSIGATKPPHTYNDVITAPTCTKRGYTTHTCTACGDTYTDSYTDIISHNYVNIICTGCGKHEYSIGLYYTLSDDKSYYIVSGIGNCEDTALMIPNVHEGIPVREIAPSAFEGNTKIVSVLFMPGETSQSIGTRAFADCSNLKDITFNNVTDIDSYAFSGCAITSLKLTDDQKIIESFAFSNCSQLTSVRIGKQILSIGTGPFSSCPALNDITVESSCDNYYASGNCLIEINTKKVIAGCYNSVIPTDTGVTGIASYAFYGCSTMTELTIPENITFIGIYAFRKCEALKSVVFVSVYNWYKTENPNEAYEKTGGTSLGIGNNAWNARYLTMYEYEYYWYRT